MASYNARIDLDVSINKALSQIKKVESAIDRLSGIGSAGKEFKEALIPDVKAFRTIERELSNIKNRANSTAKVFARIFEGVSTAGVAGAGLQALNAEMFKLAQSTGTAAASIQELDKNTGGLSRFIPGFTALKDTVGASAQEINKLQFNLQNFLSNTEGLREFVNKFYTMEGAAGAATAGLLALAGVLEGQLRESLGDIEQVSSKALGGLAEDAAKGTSELQRLINATQGTAKQYRNLIQVGEERRDSFNSASREARQATNTIVQAEKKLTDELRAQADLKRQAQGITVTELEASKGRQSIQTRQNAEAFRLKQLSEQEAVYQAIAKLNERDSTALQEKLNIQRNVTNQATLEAQRRREIEERASTGLSRRIPTPYRTAGSMGFPVALPEIEQDRRIRAREEAKQSAERALNLQKSNSLLTQGVTGLKAQVAIAEQLGGVYAEIVRSLERANDRQSQLFRARANRAQRQELGGENLQRLERINKLATNNVLQEQLKNKVALAGNAIKKNEFTVAKQIGKEIDQLLEAEDQRIDRARRVLRFRQRERQETRAIARERAKSRKEALGSAIIGGAFPLLFGQGIGAAVGGGAGGAAGGLVGGQFGFGLSLVGTALGTSFDTLVEGAKELGAALNPLTADISAITTASGLSGSKLEKLILDLEKTGDAAGALSLATKELEKVVGQRGVEALKEFSQTTQDLSNDFEVFLTKFKAFMADVFNTLFVPRAEIELRKRGETIAAARKSADPQIQSAIRELDDASSIEERVAAQDKILRLVEAEIEAKKVSVQIDRDSIQIANMQIALEEGLLEVERLGADIKDKSVQKQLEINLKLQYTIEQQKLINQLRSDEADFLVITAKLQGLSVKYEKEKAALQNRINKPTGRGRETKPPESRALSLQRQIAQERLNIAEIENKILNIGQDRLYVALEERRQIETRKNAQIQALEYARQDALNRNKVKGDEALINELYDARRLKIRNIAELASEENRVLIERITLERELAKLAGERETEDIGIDLNRQIGALERQISSPFGGQDSEMLELRIKQVQRQEDAYRALDRQIADVKTRLENDTNNKVLQDELLLLEGRRLKYKELLPVLDQVEQKELQMQQTLQKLQPLTNALSQGLTDLFTGLIDGSKDAQEVFAAMLKNMGQALIQQGSVMIAQYIAIGIARIFAGMGGSKEKGLDVAGIQQYSGIGADTRVTPFAEGGFVTGPTRALVGEGGQPEYIIPEDKMRESMRRYSNGARGSAVVPQSGETSAAGADSGVAIADRPIDVRYTVERINNVEYVTADQFQAGMRQAAQQGAVQGERRALTTLKQNTTQRRRIGL